MKLEIGKNDSINSKNICMVDSGSKSIHLRKMVRTLRDEDLFDTIEDFVKQGGEQGSGAIPVFSEDLSKTALSLQANGYRGTRTLKAFENNTAFNTSISKGSSVDIVVLNDDFIFDKNFDYGAISQGETYNKDNTDIIVTTETAKAISEYCKYNPTTQTANTLIADANAKGFEVKTIANGTTYTLLPSLSFDGVHYIDSGIVPTYETEIAIDYCITANNNQQQVIVQAVSSGDAMISYTTYKPNGRIYGRNYSASQYAFTSSIDLNRHIIKLSSLAYFDGIEIARTTRDASATMASNLFIGASNSKTYANYMRVYSATINGQLFIPSNNGTTDGLLNLSTLEFKPLTAV